MTLNRLTDTQVRKAQPDAEGADRFLNDGGGLRLLIAEGGAKYWRFAYTVKATGRRRVLSLGVYPAVTLGMARDRAEGARRLVADGGDPADKSKDDKGAPTVRLVVEEWLKRQTGVLAPRTHAATASRLRRFVLAPEVGIGDRPIRSVTTADLWPILNRLATEARGNRKPSLELAHRVKESLGQIWRYAKATGGRVDEVVTDALFGALSPNEHRPHARLKDGRAIGTLLTAIDEVEGLGVVVRSAMQLIALTFVRSRELRLATWTELDLDAAVWTIPADRMKRVRRKVAAEDHVVPLSTQAVAILRTLAEATGGEGLVFPGRSRTAPISDMTLTAALRRLGYGRDQMQIHGWRGIASTRLRDPLEFDGDMVEVQLAHIAHRSRTERSYNRAEYVARRAAMMQTYADHLDALKDEARRPTQPSGLRAIASPRAA